MLIVFGWEHREKPIANLLTCTCPYCATTTQWCLWQKTLWGSLFFIRLIPIMRESLVRCTECGSQTTLPKPIAVSALRVDRRDKALHDCIVNLIQQSTTPQS